MLALEQMVRQMIPEFTDLPHLPTSILAKKNSAKIIEVRRVQIENFLQTILSNEKVKQNPSRILEFLDLPLHFYQLQEMEENNQGVRIDINFSSQNEKLFKSKR